MMTQNGQLTDKEQVALDYLRGWVEKHGYSPTYDDLCKELDFRSGALIWYEFRGLEEQGYLSIIKTRCQGSRTRDTIVPAGKEDLPAGAADAPTAETWLEHPELLIPPPRKKKQPKSPPKPRRPRLTKTEQKNYQLICDWVRKYHETRDDNPTFDVMYREMSRDFSVRTANAVMRGIKALEKKGYLPLNAADFREDAEEEQEQGEECKAAG